MVIVDGRQLPFNVGSTIVIGPAAGEVRCVVAKGIESERRLTRMQRYAVTETGRALSTSVPSEDATPAFRLVYGPAAPWCHVRIRTTAAHREAFGVRRRSRRFGEPRRRDASHGRGRGLLSNTRELALVDGER